MAWRLAVFSASNSFFDNFPNFCRHFVFRKFVCEEGPQFVDPKSRMSGLQRDKSPGRRAAVRIGDTDYGDLGAKGG